MAEIKGVLFSLAQLEEVRRALNFLATVGVVRPESVIKGCKKFVADHPEINEHLKILTEQGEKL